MPPVSFNSSRPDWRNQEAFPRKFRGRCRMAVVAAFGSGVHLCFVSFDRSLESRSFFFPSRRAHAGCVWNERRGHRGGHQQAAVRHLAAAMGRFAAAPTLRAVVPLVRLLLEASPRRFGSAGAEENVEPDHQRVVEWVVSVLLKRPPSLRGEAALLIATEGPGGG